MYKPECLSIVLCVRVGLGVYEVFNTDEIGAKDVYISLLGV